MGTQTEEVKAKQIGGAHYVAYKIQPWCIVDEYKLNFYEGNALKYLLRRKGNRIEDLQKAIHYLEKEITMVRNKPNAVVGLHGKTETIYEETFDEHPGMHFDIERRMWVPND